MSAYPRVKPSELLPGDVFATGGRFWVCWRTPYVEYGEWDKDGGIPKSKYWECPVSGVEIRQTKPGRQSTSHERVVMTHEGPLIGVDYRGKVTKRDDLRDRLYMHGYDRNAMKAARAEATA
jgi:hypothetical protein